MTSAEEFYGKGQSYALFAGQELGRKALQNIITCVKDQAQRCWFPTLSRILPRPLKILKVDNPNEPGLTSLQLGLSENDGTPEMQWLMMVL